MVISNLDSFSEKEKKIFKKTMRIEDSVVLLKEILKFYSCPVECEAKCCKVYDIPLSVLDKKRISKISRVHKKIIENEVIEKSETFNGIEVRKKVFKKMPCPFLNNDKCKIYQQRPVTCAVYPFHAYENDQDNLVIDPCMLGRDLMFDLVRFNLLRFSGDDPGARESFKNYLEYAQKLIVSLLKADEKSQSDLPNMVVPDLTDLRFFLFELRKLSPEAIMDLRKDTISCVISSIE